MGANAVTSGADFEPCLRELVANWDELYPRLESIARHLSVSTRTLKRRLHRNGLSYRRLLDELRLRDGMSMLRDSDLSIDQIGCRVGYSSGANFSRAFRRWTGLAPGRWRARQGSGAPS